MPGVGPTLPYGVKAAITRARSTTWLAHGRGRPGVPACACCSTTASPPTTIRWRVTAPAVHRADGAPRREGAIACWTSCRGARAAATTTPSRSARSRSPSTTASPTSPRGAPGLERHGFRATVFVTTGVVDRRVFVPMVRRPAAARPRSGKKIGALDRGARCASRRTPSRIRACWRWTTPASRHEIAESRRELGIARPAGAAFAYPAGLYGDRERRLVATAGYSAAVSLRARRQLHGDRSVRAPPAADRLARPHARLRAKLGGGHDTPLPLRATYRRLRYGAPPSARACRAEMGRAQLGEVEALARPRAPRCAHRRRSSASSSSRPSAAGERGRVAGGHEQPGLTVRDELRDAAHVGCDDRQSRRHRLQDRQRRALRPAREHEDVGRRAARGRRGARRAA